MTDTEILEHPAVELTAQLGTVSPPLTLFGTDDPSEVILRATKVSKALMGVVDSRELYQTMQGDKKYLLVEAWALLGSMLGVFASTEWTRPVKEGTRTVGWEARVSVRTLSGATVAAAESMCMRDEVLTKRDGTEFRRWENAEEHAVRSMAQTRATSKALAMPLRFVAVLAGYQGTPAEEMPSRETHSSPRTGAVSGHSEAAPTSSTKRVTVRHREPVIDARSEQPRACPLCLEAGRDGTLELVQWSNSASAICCSAWKKEDGGCKYRQPVDGSATVKGPEPIHDATEIAF